MRRETRKPRRVPVTHPVGQVGRLNPFETLPDMKTPADSIEQKQRKAYDANVRTFADGREYEFEVDFNRPLINCLDFTGHEDSAYYSYDVAAVLLDFVAAGASYDVINATDPFVQTVRRLARNRKIDIYFGFHKDQYGRAVNTTVRKITLRENVKND